MVSRPLAIAGVLALLVAGGVGFALADTGTAAPSTNSTVSVNADATVERAPDRATVTVAAVGRGETAEAARNNLSGDADAITSALEDEGADVTSSRFQIRPEYEESREGREQVGYVAIHTVEAETSDVGTAGTLIDAAVDAGADRVEGVRYSLSEETRQNAREEALTTAMDNARTDAEVVAAAEDRAIGDAVTIQTSNHGRPVVYEAAAYAGDAGGQTSIEPGEVTVDASVSVTYELA
ncbi:SIMPL domain-containing protein [Haloarcula sp. S1AR25-5A]|uniref:SIMPL domain-containing protein n=1 Tax=Haloarcula terrestris TaxID=2950533 RepID=A0AAE4EVG1_9EURY|nr:SIMPL domain-containing protein [Haloarcula terrestris]MDS0219962.1 SIMPL domain-containing protein [Haloarcula terrestris]